MTFFPALRARKLAEWLQRYGLAECAGITCALVGSFVVHRLTGSAVAAAYGGAWSETLGYASVMIGRDFFAGARAERVAGRRFGARSAGAIATGLLSEFGPAGVLDTMVTRPFAMALGARVLGPARGLIAGKLVADVVFYLPVILMYERRKRQSQPAAGL
jgi:hypothetical protein